MNGKDKLIPQSDVVPRQTSKRVLRKTSLSLVSTWIAPHNTLWQMALQRHCIASTLRRKDPGRTGSFVEILLSANPLWFNHWQTPCMRGVHVLSETLLPGPFPKATAIKQHETIVVGSTPPQLHSLIPHVASPIFVRSPAGQGWVQLRSS